MKKNIQVYGMRMALLFLGAQPLLSSITEHEGEKPIIKQSIQAEQEGEEGVLQRLHAVLLKEGGDVDARDADGETLLYKEVAKGHKQVVKVLIDKKANINAKRRQDGTTPLHVAASKGNESMVKVLLKFNADKEAIDRFGETPLHNAVEEGGDQGVIALLLKKKANTNIKNSVVNGSLTPLHMAVEKGDASIVELLLTFNADKEAIDWRGNTPLHRAVRKGNDEVARILLNAGAGTRCKNKFGNTPLAFALSACSDVTTCPSVIKLLLLKSTSLGELTFDDDVLLRLWGFDPNTFLSDRERSTKLLQKWYQDVIQLLQDEANMPFVIAALILGYYYYDCVDTWMYAFKQAKFEFETSKCRET